HARGDLGRGDRGPRPLRRGGALPIHVDAALEPGPVGEHDARCDDVAAHRPGRGDLDLVVRRDVPHDLADHHHRLRVDLRRDAPVPADRQVVILEEDLAVHLALDREVLVAGQLSLDLHRLSDVHEFLHSALPCRGVAGWNVPGKLRFNIAIGHDPALSTRSDYTPREVACTSPPRRESRESQHSWPWSCSWEPRPSGSTTRPSRWTSPGGWTGR